MKTANVSKMNWQSSLIEFKNFLKLEKNSSVHTINAYLNDLNKLKTFLQLEYRDLEISQIERKHIEEFIVYLIENFAIQESTQARILSGVNSFFNYLVYENMLESNPTELVEMPKITRKLPDTLSFEEIDLMLTSIDLSTEQGTRNRAILEILYSCGLRVSELLDLKISEIQIEVQRSW